MDGLTLSSETAPKSLTTAKEKAPSVVFQPQRLKEIVEVVDLMGTVASRIREDHSNDLPTSGPGSGRGSSQTGKSARDEAIANAPEPAIMQQKLIQHLEKEVRRVQSDARKLAWQDKKGSAYALAELYRKIRRLTSLIKDIVEASTEMIKRFYISVFISRSSPPAER